MRGWYDYIPKPDAVLWFAVAFLLAWGVSVLPRALARRWRRRPSVHPEDSALTEPNLRASLRRPFLFAFGVLVIVGAAMTASKAIHVGRLVRPGPVSLSESGAWHGAAAGLIAFAIVLGVRAVSRSRERAQPGNGPASDRAGYSSGRRWRALAGAGLTVVLALGLLSTPRVLRTGWAGAVPTSVLIAGLPRLPERLIGSQASVPFDPGSLRRRLSREELWSWQVRWLHRRARDLASDPPSADALLRAVPFVDKRDVKAVATALMVCQAALVASSDPLVRGAATDVRYAMLRYRLPSQIPDLAPHQAGLTAALDDERSEVRALAATILGYADTLTPSDASRLVRSFEDHQSVQRAAQDTLAIHARRFPDVVLAALVAYADPAAVDETSETPHNRGVVLAIGMLADSAGPPLNSEGAREALAALGRSGDMRIAFTARQALYRATRRPPAPPAAQLRQSS